MDPGLYGTPDCLHYMGVYQLVRGLSDILCHGIEPSAVGYLLGWVDANLSSLLRRHVLGPCHGCWLFPLGDSSRFNVSAVRGFHDLFVHHVLATVPGSRTVYRLGKRALVLPDPVANVNILHKEAFLGHWYRRVWKRHGRPDISGYRTATTSQDRLSVDRESARLRHACTPSHHSEFDAYQTATKKIRAAGRMGRFQRAPLSSVLNRHVSELLGLVFCFLLCMYLLYCPNLPSWCQADKAQVGAYGRNIIGVSQADSINLLLIMNGVGLFGRLIPNHAADRWFGPLNTLIPFAFITGLLLYCWAAVRSRGGLIAFSVVYGLFAAGIQSLFPATLSSLTTDLKKMGVRMGMVFSVVSFACLTGPPLAGALVQKDNGGYLYAQMFAGTSLMCGCLTLVCARIARTGLSFKHRM